MATRWTVTIDCAEPRVVARFWAEALGYVEPPGWAEWLREHDVPDEEWDDGAYLSDPDGVLPKLSFLKVPESKVVKNRVHLDIQAGGGRDTPWEVRWPRVRAEVERLTALGATVLYEDEWEGRPDHVTMADPEGNEFCVL